MIYKWKDSSRFKADAEKVQDELKKIGDNIKPDDVVKYAEKKRSELNKCFEWDDSKASHLYRLDQARQILRSIVFIPEESKKEQIEYEIRAYENIVENDERSYKLTTEILKDEELAEQLIISIIKNIREYERKLTSYQHIGKNIINVKFLLQDFLKKVS